jgi:hypothetical protein
LSGVERFSAECEVSGSYSKIAVAESPGLFGNPDEAECPLLETVTRGIGKAQQTEKI